MPILRLTPAGKDYLWGGTRLRDEYRKPLTLTPLAEMWECSVHPDGLSMVACGAFAGQSLRDVLSAHPEYLGRAVPDGQMPLLVKLIDAQQALAVQVHPKDDFARRVEHDRGKTEMWYVMDAEPGAKLVYGFHQQMTAQQVRQAVRTDTLDACLQQLSVHPGDVFYVPAGLVHGIGAGILVAEIQESSNVTYRVYDYDRTDKNGQKRELHVEKALQVMQLSPTRGTLGAKHPVLARKGYTRQLLCRCRYFTTERICVQTAFPLRITQRAFQVLLCLKGEARVCAGGECVQMRKGECLFLSAGLGQVQVEGETVFLRITV